MLEAIQKALEAPSEDRLGMPLTYVVGPDGERHVLSRYGDDRIDMSPYMKNPAQSQRHIDMTLFPERWRSSVTDLLMAFWRYGRPGRAAPKASTVLNKAVLLTPLVRWLHKKKVAGFSSVRPLHLTAFVEEYAAADEQGNARKAGTIAGILGCGGRPCRRPHPPRSAPRPPSRNPQHRPRPALAHPPREGLTHDPPV